MCRFSCYFTLSEIESLSDPTPEPAAAWSSVDVFAPLTFVLVWSTGFIVAKFGLPYAPTLTFLLLRFGGVLLILLPTLLLVRAPWPSGLVWHIAVAGLLVQALIDVNQLFVSWR